MAANITIQNADFSLAVVQVIGSDLKQIADDLVAFAPEQDEDLSFVPCVLEIQHKSIESTFLAQMVELLRQYRFLPVGLRSDDGLLSEQAAYAGLAIFNGAIERLESLDNVATLSATGECFDDDGSDEDADIVKPLLHHSNVEAGQQLYAEDKDLVIFGDVAKGAEVIADGSIYIGGSLLGKAYAGNSGLMNIDQNSVRAYVFEPELVSIAGFYQLNEDIPTQYKGLPVKAKFINQRFEYALE